MTLNVDQLLDAEGITVIVGRPGQWYLQSFRPELAYSHEFYDLVSTVARKLDPQAVHMRGLRIDKPTRHCTLCARTTGDFMCRKCVELHTEPAGTTERSARLQLAAVRKWMAEKYMQHGYATAVAELRDVMLHADKEEDHNGQ